MASLVVNSLLSIFGTPIRSSCRPTRSRSPGGGGEKNEIGTKSRRCSVRARGEGKGGEKNVSLNHLRPYHPRQTPMTRIVDDRYTLPVRYREPVMIEGPRRQGPDTNKRVSHENTIADDSGLSSCTRYRNGKKSTRNPSK